MTGGFLYIRIIMYYCLQPQRQVLRYIYNRRPYREWGFPDSINEKQFDKLQKIWYKLLSGRLLIWGE